MKVENVYGVEIEWQMINEHGPVDIAPRSINLVQNGEALEDIKEPGRWAAGWLVHLSRWNDLCGLDCGWLSLWRSCLKRTATLEVCASTMRGSSPLFLFYAMPLSKVSKIKSGNT